MEVSQDFSHPKQRTVPSKSIATMRASSVGVTDIQTPSVVRMADPAKDVSTKWFNAKLLPTDCSPIEETTLTGCVR
jgi:hypothetical protein